MPITIVKEKKQRARTVMVEEAIASLGVLLTLKKLASKMEKGIATPAEKRHYKKHKPRAWSTAQRCYAKADKVLQLNGNGKPKQ